MRRDTPDPARVYNCLAGGHENHEADRALAGRLTDAYPRLPELVRDARAFAAKAARWAAAMRGTDQFVALGCGFPLDPAVHEAVRLAAPLAVTVYVDQAAEVVRSAEAAWWDSPGVTVTQGDPADPGAVLADQRLRGVIDLSRPVAVVFGTTLSALDAETARKVVAGYADALAPGSSAVLACISFADTGLAARLTGIYGDTGEWHNHDAEAVGSFFEAGGLRIVHKRVMDTAFWPAFVSLEEPGPAMVLGGIGVRDQL